MTDRPVKKHSDHLCLETQNLRAIDRVESDQKISTDQLKSYLMEARFLNPDDSLIKSWNYSPWITGRFSTPAGDHHFSIYRGGLGVMSCPHQKENFFLISIKP